MKEIILAIIFSIISIGCFIMSFRSFREKGFLFNNAYLYASEKERNTMDKRPHYRQSAIAFLLISIIFLFNAIDVLLKTDWIFYLIIVIGIIAIIYAIISSILIEKSKK